MNFVGGWVNDPKGVFGGRPRVLIVEDVACIAKMYATALERSGFEVAVAHDGLRAWIELQKKRPPSLLVLDLDLPIVGGLALLERLRRRRGPPPGRTLIVTTESESAEVERAFALGAHGYLFKPITERELRDAAERLCAHATGSRSVTAPWRTRGPGWLVTP